MSISRRIFLSGAAAAPVALSAATEALGAEAHIVSSEDVIEFVYIDSASLPVGEEQHIALGLAAAADGIATAELTLRTEETSELTVLPLANASDSAVLFSFTPESAATYSLSSLSYTAGEASAVVDFSDCASPVRTFAVCAASEGEGMLTNVTTFNDDAAAEPQTVCADEDELLSEEVDLTTLSDASGNLLIALNPGHGGNDSGATSNGAREADMTWAIYQACRAELELYSGVKVFCTRTQNECPTLQERVNRAKGAGCDAYVSLHINASGGIGAEVYYPYNSSYNKDAYTVGKSLADSILSELNKLGIKNRGSKVRIIDEVGRYGYDSNGDGKYDTYADYYGDIRYSRLAGMPGIIVEHAFIDSSDYYNYLNTTGKLQALGRADATAIAKVYGLSKEADDPNRIKMYRLYNRYTGEHFYTSSTAERVNLIDCGWSSEGIAWRAPKSGDPVYRLYNPNVSGGDHHYTTSADELIDLVNRDWRHEGIGWYSDSSKAVAVYRLYNPNAVTGTHHYTTDSAERNSLVEAGWKDEGIGWYGVK
ncbi:N-acetylmuramoyl-L-alanine amidase [Paratractidigestivibacter sp.]|uniref:N-acetylmuramoyl-L-alanine amidase n=3 Tax=Paratractidigestivibacter sp. TaxID=2847316 RepID=UPI002ABE1101|nr:N-acetylmuramoyl-L-alanine amidase [Paratractidigestivibacter sp.]